MSSAFVKESEGQNLNEVAPNLSALLLYLKQEHGTSIREEKMYYSPRHARDVYEMSDGLTYALNNESKWYIILD